MTTDVLTFHPEDKVQSAAEAMAQRSIGGAPVIDGDGKVVGMLRDDDLIVSDVRLHAPTVISVLGAYLAPPSTGVPRGSASPSSRRARSCETRASKRRSWCSPSRRWTPWTRSSVAA